MKVFYQLCIIDLMKINIHQQIFKWNVFLKHIQLIKDLNYEFIHPEDFQKNFNIPKKQKKYY